MARWRHRREGLFTIERPDVPTYRKAVDGDDYHVQDIGLFYMDLRANAADRVAAYARQNPKP